MTTSMDDRGIHPRMPVNGESVANSQHGGDGGSSMGATARRNQRAASQVTGRSRDRSGSGNRSGNVKTHTLRSEAEENFTPRRAVSRE